MKYEDDLNVKYEIWNMKYEIYEPRFAASASICRTCSAAIRIKIRTHGSQPYSLLRVERVGNIVKDIAGYSF
jgi:hypothetical protein